MPTTKNAPDDRLTYFDLKSEKFKSTGIKESTLRRLNIARKHGLYTTWERDAYFVIERALEIYYHNTTVIFHGRDWNLLDLINHLEVQNENKDQDQNQEEN